MEAPLRATTVTMRIKGMDLAYTVQPSATKDGKWCWSAAGNNGTESTEAEAKAKARRYLLTKQ